MLSFLLCMNTQAQMFYVEPQIRTGAGIAWVDGAFGASVSMDTRMTHLVYVGLGGFRSFEMPQIETTDDDIQTWSALRHAIWAAPGFRFPHRYAKDGVNWDFLIRGGFGATFSALAEEEDWFLMEPSGLYGADIILFGDTISVKASGKMFVYSSYIPEFREKALMMRPQVSIELSYEW